MQNNSLNALVRQEFPLATISGFPDLKRNWKPLPTIAMGFPDSSVGKESTCNVGDLGSIPGLGRSPGKGKDYPLQYSGLENSMDYRRSVQKISSQLRSSWWCDHSTRADILECEVKWALESITMNKASRGDGIPVELFQILKDDAVKVLYSIC